MTAKIVSSSNDSLGGTHTSGTSASAITSRFYWKLLTSLNSERQEVSVAVVIELLNGSSIVVAVGGRSDTSPSLSNVEALEWNVQRTWWKLPSLQRARCGCSTVAVGSQLYCVGGLGLDSRPYDTLEWFDIVGTEEAWKTLEATMSTPRMYLAAAAFHDDKDASSPTKIMVVGGRDANFQELSSCEVFDTTNQSWQTLPAVMSMPRFGAALVYWKSSHALLILGGFTGSEWTTSSEQFNIITQTWSAHTVVPDMPKAVQFCSATVLFSENEEYIVVSGIYPETEETILQAYRVSTQEWAVLPATLSRKGVAMTAVDQQSRLLVLGGSHGEQCSNDCRFWMPQLSKLFTSQGKVGGTTDGMLLDTNRSQSGLTMDSQDRVSAPTEPLLRQEGGSPSKPHRRVKSSGTRSNATSNKHDDCEDQSTVHPWLYPNGAASIASASSASTNLSSSQRRKVDNETVVDNFGVPVQFTGFLAAESGRPHGKGRMTWPLTGDVYEGRFDHGARQGRGHMIYHNGDNFLGFFSNDKREGRGMYQYRDGRVYEGKYRNDMPEDKNGVMRWKDGTTYTGQFVKAKRTGYGKIEFPGNMSYEGNFVNGKYNGQGECRFGDGSIYVGEWNHGKAQGQGILKDAQGNVVHDGRWANDSPVYI